MGYVEVISNTRYYFCTTIVVMRNASLIRFHADTSTYGGLFDVEFALGSRLFFEQVKDGRFHLLTSAVVVDKINHAPLRVQEAYYAMLPYMEIVAVHEAALRLQQAYLDAGVVARKWQGDALHVAEVVVRWNFKRIVNYSRIRLYNRVNRQEGWNEIDIRTALEVLIDEEETL